MATITPVSIDTAGEAVTYAAATVGGDSIAAGIGNTNCKLLIINAGSSITVTLAGAVTCSQGALHNSVFTVAAGNTQIHIPAQCINPTTGAVAVTYSSVTSVTVAATTG